MKSETTWNIASAGIGWQTPGASGANDREGIEIGSIQILANEALNTEKRIFLSTSRIQELVSGAFANNGFLIKTDTEENDRFNYKTSDNTTTSQRPKLVVQYSLDTVVSIATGTYTSTPNSTRTNTATPSRTLVFTATKTATPTPTASRTPTAPTSTRTPTPLTATVTSTITPTVGPGAIWLFNETTSTPGVLDSAPGTPYSHGTLVGGAERVPGFGTQAIRLATGRYVNIPRLTEQEPASGFTISMWLFPTEIQQGSTYVILNKGGSAQDYRLYINSNRALVFRVNDLSPNELAGPVLDLNTWVHVVAVYDRPAGKLKLFLNGTLVASRTVTGTISYATTAGITVGDPTNPFIGMVDEVYF
ncbi:MAG: disaggregatase related repeat-containing protein [Anaerolineales bacterium]